MYSVFLATAFCVSSTIASADAVGGVSGVWISKPQCEDGEYFVEFFNDGTAFLSLRKDGVAHRAIYITVKATNKRDSFLLADEDNVSVACFDVKETGLAIMRLMHSAQENGVVRMERQGDAR